MKSFSGEYCEKTGGVKTPFLSSIDFIYEEYSWQLMEDEKYKPKELLSLQKEIVYDGDGNLIMNDEDVRVFLSKRTQQMEQYDKISGGDPSSTFISGIIIDEKTILKNEIRVYPDSASLIRTASRSFNLNLKEDCKLLEEVHKVNKEGIMMRLNDYLWVQNGLCYCEKEDGGTILWQ
tara:strand:+ start:313 stop:843 length:531 start_codon:yes stop_codon:yes gene_type:complete